MDESVYAAGYWLARAREITSIARTMKSPEARLQLATIVQSYKLMAVRARKKGESREGRHALEEEMRR